MDSSTLGYMFYIFPKVLETYQFANYSSKKNFLDLLLTKSSPGHMTEKSKQSLLKRVFVPM